MAPASGLEPPTSEAHTLDALPVELHGIRYTHCSTVLTRAPIAGVGLSCSGEVTHGQTVDAGNRYVKAPTLETRLSVEQTTLQCPESQTPTRADAGNLAVVLNFLRTEEPAFSRWHTSCIREVRGRLSPPESSETPQRSNPRFSGLAYFLPRLLWTRLARTMPGTSGNKHARANRVAVATSMPRPTGKEHARGPEAARQGVCQGRGKASLQVACQAVRARSMPAGVTGLRLQAACQGRTGLVAVVVGALCGPAYGTQALLCADQPEPGGPEPRIRPARARFGLGFCPCWPRLRK